MCTYHSHMCWRELPRVLFHKGVDLRNSHGVVQQMDVVICAACAVAGRLRGRKEWEQSRVPVEDIYISREKC